MTNEIERYIEFTLNIGCNNKCIYCPQDVITKAYKDKIKVMDFYTFKKCLSNIPKKIKIVFGGMSEPFQNPDVMRMMSYAYINGYKIGLYTTINGFKEEYCEDLKELTFDALRLHLPDDDKAMKIKVNNKYLRSLVTFMKVIKTNNMIITDMKSDKYLMGNRAGNLDLIKKVDNKFKNILCCGDDEPQTQIVLPNGDVVICCNDYNLDHVVGNLTKDSYYDIKKNVKESGLPLNNTICRYCDFASDKDKIIKCVNKGCRI